MAAMKTVAPAPQIGPLLLTERKARKLTLEQLAARSGVSKSMLSQIERNEANPTFAVLWSLTQALGIEFSTLIAGSAVAAHRDSVEVVPAIHTPEIRSADGKCVLKILSPPRLAGETEWYQLEMAPGGVLRSTPHAPGAFEHFTALTDGFSVESAGATARLRAGETARYAADVPHAISNTGPRTARGLLILLYH
jgi:transcriptional regulator with XRE-family HTH domain